MRFATIRTSGGTRAARIEADVAIELPMDDIGALLRLDGLASATSTEGPRHALDDVEYATPVLVPGKILCVGLNYRSHITEMGRDLPKYPTLFAKFPETLLGPYDDLLLPPESQSVDWEAELAVVIGGSVRRADMATAEQAIAGYSIVNDISMRDWQFRTTEWLQGKIFEATTPFGPHLVTPDELPPDAAISCSIDGEVMQHGRLGDLLFGPAELVSYVSSAITLNPGDVIITGTTGGVGHARTPPRYLQAGQRVTTSIEGIGAIVNNVRAEAVPE